MDRLETIARSLDAAALNATAVPQLDADNAISIGEAYQVQAASIACRLARGERRVGVKMGFTSRAKMVQMGIEDMIWGRLTDGMQVEDGAVASVGRYVHPRIEPEIAFLIKRDLDADASFAEAAAALEAVAPAMEIIDSRYKDFKFSLTDVVADNASSSGFVVGAWQRPGVDLSNLGMIMSINGRAVQIGSSASILGNPLRSLVSAARLSAAAGEPLRAGWIVMAGGATAAEKVLPGARIRLEVERLGSVDVQFKE